MASFGAWPAYFCVLKAAVWRKFVRSPAAAVVMVAWLVNKTIINERA